MVHQTRLIFDRLDALGQAGQWQSALRLCEDVYKDAWRKRDLRALIDIFIRSAFFFGRSGNTEAAVDNFLLATRVSEMNGSHSQTARALNGLGIVYQNMGDLEAADSNFSDALKYARVAKDRIVVGDILTNLGIIENIKGNLSGALRRYNEAYGQYEDGAEKGRIARVLNNIGMLQIDLGSYEEADSSLERALNIARSIDDLPTEGIILTNKTELYLALKQLDRARTACDTAFEIASRLNDTSLKAELLKFYGMIARNNKQTHLAELYLEQALELANNVENKLLQAEVERDISVLYLQLERSREALEHFIAAHNLFSALQAENETADITTKLAELETDFMRLVVEWGESIEAKDRYTSGHCKRVAHYACEIARELGLSDLELNWFRMGAFLHDIGKTETPEEILNKPGKLTSEERRIIEEHTVIGDRLLSAIEFPWNIRPMVRSHHERWDGSGYPDRLAGGDIPYSARILKIADVFDALTTNRSYRKPLSFGQAFEIMEGDDGAFDPDMFQVFVKLLPKWEQSELFPEEGFAPSASG